MAESKNDSQKSRDLFVQCPRCYKVIILDFDKVWVN